jgi:hypothetical protein
MEIIFSRQVAEELAEKYTVLELEPHSIGNDVLETFLVNGKIETTLKGFTIAKDARFLADGIASDFFIV